MLLGRNVEKGNRSVSTNFASIEESVGQSGACDSVRWDRGVLSATAS
jgi:hypothetical protein